MVPFRFCRKLGGSNVGIHGHICICMYMRMYIYIYIYVCGLQGVSALQLMEVTYFLLGLIRALILGGSGLCWRLVQRQSME